MVGDDYRLGKGGARSPRNDVPASTRAGLKYTERAVIRDSYACSTMPWRMRISEDFETGCRVPKLRHSSAVLRTLLFTYYRAVRLIKRNILRTILVKLICPASSTSVGTLEIKNFLFRIFNVLQLFRILGYSNILMKLGLLLLGIC